MFGLGGPRASGKLLELVELPDSSAPVDGRPPRAFHPRWMYCRIQNDSPEPLFVYGPRHASDPTSWPTSLFLLPPARRTPKYWDCKGILIPADRTAAQGSSIIQGPIALKYRDLRRVTITISDRQYQCPRSDGVLERGQMDFAVPPMPYSELLVQPRRRVTV
jgi:hypothetical protein